MGIKSNKWRLDGSQKPFVGEQAGLCNPRQKQHNRHRYKRKMFMPEILQVFTSFIVVKIILFFIIISGVKKETLKSEYLF